MKPSGKRWALWLENSRDPDNWFDIPDFGVKPADVNWEGFALPILHVMHDTRPGARPESVYTIVQATRKMARQHFSSLKDLRECFREFLDLIDAEKYEDTSERQRVAFVYQTTMWELKRNALHRHADIAADSIASATATLVAWVVGHSIDLSQERSERARTNANKPRVDVSPEDVAAYAALVGYPAIGKFEIFVEQAAAHFSSQGKSVSPTTIGRRMREARGKNLMS